VAQRLSLWQSVSDYGVLQHGQNHNVVHELSLHLDRRVIT
jgi:hypothetical protein